MLGYLEPGSRAVTQFGRMTVRYIPAHLDEKYANSPISGVTKFKSFRHFCIERRPQKIVFLRGHAAGDIVMLVAIIRALRRALNIANPITVSTEIKMLNQFSGLNGKDVVFAKKVEFWHRFGADCVFNLNSCLELDHRGGEASNWHRMDLYAQALGFSRCDLAY